MDKTKTEAQRVAEINAIAQGRIGRLTDATARYIASSYASCVDSPQDLAVRLRAAQQQFFTEFGQIAPVDVESLETARDRLARVDFDGPVVIISNHPPFEKAIKPDAAQFQHALNELGRSELVEGTTAHLPGVIARRGVINSILSQLLPGQAFGFSVVGAKFDDPPMSTIQDNDGSIVLPYGQGGQGGFEALSAGVNRVFDKNRSAQIPVVVAFPEGGNSKTTVEVLAPFHGGIFVASQQYATASGRPVTILPLAMGVRSDFSIGVKVLDPFLLRPDSPSSTDLQSLHDHMQKEYQSLLHVMPHGWYWKGLEYPYGGPAKSAIVQGKQ